MNVLFMNIFLNLFLNEGGNKDSEEDCQSYEYIPFYTRNRVKNFI